jgi:hypothetical protein
MVDSANVADNMAVCRPHVNLLSTVNTDKTKLTGLMCERTDCQIASNGLEHFQKISVLFMMS